MAEMTVTLTEYSGVIPNPKTQSQAELDAAATQTFGYWVVVCPELNAFSLQANGLRSDVIAAQDAAIAARDNAQTYRDQALAYRDSGQLYATAAATGAHAAQTAQSAAEQAATDAQGYAALAQATNPDAPIRYNTNTITSDITLPAGHNGLSAGPIAIADGARVSVPLNTHWSIL